MTGGVLLFCVWASVVVAGAICLVVGYVQGVRRMMRHQPKLLDVARSESYETGKSEGFNEGWHHALRQVAGSETRDESYRIAAAKIGKFCPACCKTCIHCAKQSGRS